MIKGEILRELFKSLNSQNEIDIYNVLIKLIKYEKERKNYALADELNNMIPKRFKANNRRRRSRTLLSFNIPKDSSRDIPLLEIKNFNINGNQLIVSDGIKNSLDRIIIEYNKKHILRIYNLNNISKLLFFGPPGCGKTLSAHLLSSQLHLPLVYVRFDGLISSYLGETSANLKKVFDFVSEGNWILFFDEFDAIGKTRQDMHDNGEMKRVINSFLQQLDNYKGEALIICATNFYESLDPAIWRRFDDILFFNYPTKDLRIKLLKLFLNDFPIKKINYDILAEQMDGMSCADIEQVCLRIIKNSLIQESQIETKDITIQTNIQMEKNKFKTKFLNYNQNGRKT